MPSGSPPLEEVTARHVRVLRLNRPERKNALSTELGWALIDAVRRAEADDDVRIIALTGNGDAFCSGLDLAPVEGAEVDTGLSAQQHALDDYGWVGRFLLTFRLESTKPIVAGINGVAVGAGLSLAMCADIATAIADTVEHLTLEETDGALVARTPSWFGDVVFGGFVLAQAIAAATRGAPGGRRLHSLHAYFLRPVAGGTTIAFRSTVLREGRTFATQQLRAEQHDKLVLSLTSSFTADTHGDEYDLGGLAPDVPQPDDDKAEPGPGPWQACWVGPTPPADDGTRTSTHRMWFRVPARLPDDHHLHTALLGFATDWTGVGGRPLRLDGDTQGMISLDHAVWFHRPARADEWLFYDVHSLVNAGGRGLLRGVIRDRDGRVMISVAQEMLLRPA